ncbi:MAG TPA: phage major capsid protein [Vitreimonas sp.]|nr:phage major capsid protein [Vitreimonas sp.]
MSVVAQINDLKQQRASLIEEMRDMTVAAEAEGRDLTADEAEKFDKLEKDADEFERRAARLEKFEGIEPKGKRQISHDPTGGKDDDGERKLPETFKEFQEQRAREMGVRPQDDPEYRAAFFKWLTTPDVRSLDGAEVRVLSKASAGAGLNLVPTTFARELVNVLRNFGVMRQISRIITTDSGETMQVPTVTAHGAAAWTAENAAFTASDETFGQASLGAYKAGTLIKVSEELLADSAFDLEAYIRQEFGERIGVLENTAYVAGDGAGKPTGVATQASAGATAAGAGAITYADLVNLYHSLGPQYRRNAVFVMNDAGVKAVRLLTDTSGMPLWQPSMQAGEPDRILGKPIYADPDMATVATGNISALFGDFSYYWIRDVNGIAFQRLTELYAENGQVGFRAYHRTDGRLLNTAAVKKLTQP